MIYYGIIAYMPYFLNLYVKMPPNLVANVVLATNLAWLVTSPLFGYLSDLFKVRKYMLVAVYTATLALTYPIIRAL
ncbi:MAG: hypothetical protein ACP5HK_01990 [Acidilobus sp.]